MKFLLITLVLVSSVNAFAKDNNLVVSNRVEIVKLDKGNATIRINVCPADAEIEVGIKFTQSSDRLTYAELEVLVPNEQCYANTHQDVIVNLSELVKEKAKEKSINSEYLLLKQLPVHIEVMQ